MGDAFERIEALLEDMRRRMDRLEEKLRPEPTAVEFQEAARMLSCSSRHIARMVAKGELKVKMVGSLRRISVEAIRALRDAPPPTVKKGRPTRTPKYSAAAEMEQYKARRR